MDAITKQFIEYWDVYGDGQIDYEAGDFACKYCESQEHVNQVLNEIDEHYGIG